MSTFVAWWADEGRRLRESLAREADAPPASSGRGDDVAPSTSRPWDARGEVALAVARARARREVSEMLEHLSAGDRRGVLLDLLGELALGELPPDSARGYRDAAPSAVQPRGPGRPAVEEGPVANRSLALLETLRANPRTPTWTLAEIAYGSRARKHRDRVRALLAALKRRGLVRSAAPGLWEAVAVAAPESAGERADAHHDVPVDSTIRRA